MKKIFLMLACFPLLAFANTPFFQQELYLAPPVEPLHTWNFACYYKKYPDRGEASAFTNGKQVNVEICSAQQTIQQYVLHFPVTASAEISTFNILFKVKNLQLAPRGSKLIVGDQHSYSLFNDCSSNVDQNVCVLTLANEKQKNKITREMSKADSFVLKVNEQTNHQPIQLVFSLKNFQNQMQKIANTEKNINLQFKTAF
ncbi:MAG: hypothetical protein ABIH77_02675 [Pseudomonadota bacterium]|nr:hypothetical protein [Gammaproteobacteria bacterium]MBU1559172.1 hypothetical protein [Gammaproteobacteria bacterium]MBU1628878.1 hypothetical protein [Gammaproteobacteria bacterium]MBU1926445.1 hypothetical protein [Gammaproteobacteria bacterium]MBU2545727.1 hypothetical protein [Gammaproteobacteria bacterium]